MGNLQKTNERMEHLLNLSILTQEVQKEVQMKKDKIKDMQVDLMNITQRIKYVILIGIVEGCLRWMGY